MHLLLLGNANRMTLSLSPFLVELQPSGTLPPIVAKLRHTLLAVIIKVRDYGTP
jgi:hypothetical protein